MPRKRTERDEMSTRSAREMAVVKRDDMIQHARFSLTVQQQRCVLYAISRIQPDDTDLKEYSFELKDFYAICGIEDESYTRLKQILKELSDKSWWAVIDDKGTESLLRWFTTLRTNKRSGKVTVEFHKDMKPYLLELAKQAREAGAFYTQYGLKYVLPMRSQFSPRLYEVLKSYQKNNREWYFDVEELKRLLDCANYRWPDFRRRALEPAIEEINAYTDLNVAYDTETGGRGGKVNRVIFYMAGKSKKALQETERLIVQQLDGQMTLEEMLLGYGDSVKRKFFAENPITPENE